MCKQNSGTETARYVAQKVDVGHINVVLVGFFFFCVLLAFGEGFYTMLENAE